MGIQIGIGIRIGSGSRSSISIWTPPSELTLLVVSATRIDTSWIGVEAASIERSTNGTDFSEIGTVTKGTFTYSDTTVTAGNTYYYKVREVKAGNYSGYSIVINANLSTLLTGLLAYYKLENVNDSIGGYTLTNTNAVPFATGKIGNCADTGNSNSNKRLEINTDFGLTNNDSKSFAFWFKINTEPAEGETVCIFMFLIGANPGHFVELGYNKTSGALTLILGSGDYYNITLTLGLLYCGIITWDVPNNQLKLYVNNVIHTTHALWSADYSALTSRFTMFSHGAADIQYASAGVDDFAVYNKVLSVSERAEYYDNGFGKSFPLNYSYFSHVVADWAFLGCINFYSAVYFNGKTYIAYQGDNDDPYVLTYTHSSGLFSAPVKIGVSPIENGDGHGAPAIFIDSSGYIHCIYGAHITEFQYKKSTNTEDISAWSVIANPCPETESTYPQFIQFSNGTIYLFYRNHWDVGTRSWGYVTSTNGGTSWSAYTQIVSDDFAYCYAKKGIGDTIHCAITKGTSAANRQNIYYMIFNGSVWKNISGATQALPIDLPATAVLAYDSGSEWVPNIAYGFDSSNNIYLHFTEGHTSDASLGGPGTFTYKFIKWNGSAWVVSLVGTSSDNWRDFETAIDVISDSIIDIYVITAGTSDAIGGNVELWRSTNRGVSFNKINTLLQGQLIDPIIVKDYNSKAKLIFAEFRNTITEWTGKGYLWGDTGFVK